MLTCSQPLACIRRCAASTKASRRTVWTARFRVRAIAASIITDRQSVYYSGRAAILSPAAPEHHRGLRRNELDSVSGHHHLPAAFVDEAVVEVAERDQAMGVGLATVLPELEVVGVGPAERPLAARRRAGGVPRL